MTISVPYYGLWLRISVPELRHHSVDNVPWVAVPCTYHTELRFTSISVGLVLAND
jgi:hypothetical protein